MITDRGCCDNCNNACRHEIWGTVFYTCKLHIGLNPTVNPYHTCDDWDGPLLDFNLGLTYDIWT